MKDSKLTNLKKADQTGKTCASHQSGMPSSFFTRGRAMDNIQKLIEGDVIYLHGYEFTVTDLKEEVMHDGCIRAIFTGVCTDDSRNDGIRNSGYNHSQYGGNHRVYDWSSITGETFDELFARCDDAHMKAGMTLSNLHCNL